MTRRGRKPKGPELVTRLEGSDTARERLRRIVETLTGQASVVEVCAELGIGESRFHQLRSDALQAALGRLEPRAAGRPATPVSPTDARVAELESQLRELKWELQAAQIRLELAQALPGLASRQTMVKKTTRPSATISPTGSPAETPP